MLNQKTILEWQAREAAKADRRHKQSLIVAIVGVIVALVVGILTTLAVLPTVK